MVADGKQPKAELSAPMRAVVHKLEVVQQRRNRSLPRRHIGHVLAKRHKPAAHVKRIRIACQNNADEVTNVDANAAELNGLAANAADLANEADTLANQAAQLENEAENATAATDNLSDQADADAPVNGM